MPLSSLVVGEVLEVLYLLHKNDIIHGVRLLLHNLI